MSDDFISRLTGLVGERGIVTSPAEMAPYLEDWRGREHGRARAIVLPRTTEEVAAVVKLCAETGTAVFPQGGNTSLCVAATPGADADGIVLGLKRMNAIRSLDRASSAMVVDGGVVLSAIHEAAATVGRQFPLHLGSEGTAQIGGLISTNAGGTGVLRYGPTRDLVMGLEVVLADGRVWNGLSTLRKDNTGYDLKNLFIGAEGTLGIITGAALKLAPALRARADAWLSVAGPEEAVTLLGALQDVFDTNLQAFELLSRSEIQSVLDFVPGRHCPFGGAPAWSVMVELGAPDPEAALTARLEETLAEAMEAGTVLDGFIAQNETQSADIWQVRHSVSESNKKRGVGLTHDVSVPVSQVARFIAETDAMVAEHYPSAEPVVVAHMGDGNVHYIVMFDHDWWQDVTDRKALQNDVMHRVHDIAMALGGSYSAEHGIGRKLTAELERLTSPVELDLFHRVKAMLDPDGLMNPGAVLNP